MTTDTGANGAVATIDAPPPPPQAPPTTDLARPQRVAIQSGARGLELRGFEEMWKFALAVQRSGLAPKGVQTPEAILVALQMGAEVGLSPMAALQNTAVINGRPSLFGDAQLAVVRGSGLFVEEEFDEWYSDGNGNRLPESAPFEPGMVSHTRVMRRGNKKAVERTFSYADALDAKLLNKDGPWQQYPKRMLRWRSRGYALRDVFTDVLRGIPSAEEVRDRAELTDVVEGAIVIPSDRRGMSELGQQLERLRQQQTTPPAAGVSPTEAPAAPQSQPADTPAGPAGATATDEPPSPAPDRPAADLKRDAENQWSEFIDSQWTIAQQKGSARGDFDNAVKKALVRVGKVRKAHETDDQFRALLARDVAEGTGPFEYLNQTPAQ